MKRRQLIGALGAAVCGAAMPILAQQLAKVWRIGYLVASSRTSSSDRLDAFRRGMRDLGYIEGKNLIIEQRYADGAYERLPGLAAELAKMQVDVIVASGSVSTRAAQQATSAIPIVALGAGDPVGSGFAASLAHPGGNITGLSVITADLAPKRVELLMTIAHHPKRIALLLNPGNPTYAGVKETFKAVGQKIGIEILALDAHTPDEIERAFTTMKRERAGAVIVSADNLLFQQRKQIVELAAKHRLPAMSNGYASMSRPAV